MKRNYTKPTIEAVPLNMDCPLLARSNSDGIRATISGYQSSDDDHIDADDGDDFDGFSQDFEN
jgi:hypothetical protein